LYRLRVLQHVEGQSPAGSVLFNRLYVFEKGGGKAGREKVKQMCRWAVGTGIAEFRDVDGKDVLIDKRSNSPAVTLVSLRNIVGCQIVAEVKKESSSQYGESFKISFCECFRPDDPKVAHVSKNHEAIRAREAFELCQCLPK